MPYRTDTFRIPMAGPADAPVTHSRFPAWANATRHARSHPCASRAASASASCAAASRSGDGGTTCAT